MNFERVGGTHYIVWNNGAETLATFTGLADVLAYGQAHGKVVKIRTVRGTVEYGPEDD